LVTIKFSNKIRKARGLKILTFKQLVHNQFIAYHHHYWCGFYNEKKCHGGAGADKFFNIGKSKAKLLTKKQIKPHLKT
jgi:ATP-dependent Zn protease